MSVRQRPRQQSAWWWAAWLLLGFAFAVQALRIGAANAFVRSGNAASAAAVRPQNGRGLALLASAHMARGNASAARAASRAALRQTPLAVIAVRSLAQAEARLGAPAASERAWQIASLMGWRDPPTQSWALVRALTNGEAAVFAMRAEALFRIGDRDGRVGALIRQSMVEPAIRRAFVAALADNPEWRLRLFASGRALSGRELDGVLLAVHDLGAGPTPPTRHELRSAIAGLIDARRYAEAVALDRRFVSRAPDRGSLVDDGGFDLDVDYGNATTPFDWIIVANHAVVDPSGRRSLVVASQDSAGATAVQRYVRLRPGRYVIRFSISGTAGAPAAVAIRAHCAGSEQLLGSSPSEPLAADGWHERAFTLLVPPGCALVRIVIGGTAGSEPAEALIDDIAIRAAP